MKTKHGPVRDELPDSACACATLRRAARLVTQLYDEELRPHLPASQFALLSAIAKRPKSTQSALARTLAFDKTTLSRNLALLKKNGWIEYTATDDQRERGVRLTAAGADLLVAAKPGWRRAQKRLQSAMTAAQWNTMWRVLRDVTNSAYQARKVKEEKRRR
jgi:DNA-binding MarR family transcriptional regulator